MGREIKSWACMGALFLLASAGFFIIKANKGMQYQGGNSWIGYAVVWTAVAGLAGLMVVELWRCIRK
jgi:hypothetical protein